MRRFLIALAGLIVLAVANVGIYQKQALLESGRVVLLQLAPVDPRSLMQGDYMALRFKVADDAFRTVDPESASDGRIVLTIDERNVGTFARFDAGGPLAQNEVVMWYRFRDRLPKFATNAFFFQEGTADLYSTARYGEFRVGSSGDSILTRMRNDKLEVLGPPPK